ncbi:hypothetical protein [Luethyella okanaganae]|uniref:Alpha/beta hydrolase n=1 Tax=Luethyella okanaganae TaxID=69372 RepID=A0ABW1VHU6_9MICO
MIGQWSDAAPGAADVHGIRGLARQRYAAAQQLRDGTVVRLSRAAEQSAAWVAETATRFALGVDRLQPEVLQIVSGLENDAAVLTRYAAAVEQIRDKADALEAKRDRLLDDVIACRGALAPIPTAFGGGTSDDAAARARLEGRLDAFHASLRGVDAEWRQLAVERRHADASAVAALTGGDSRGALAQWTNTGAAADVLDRMAGLSAVDVAVLAAANPGLFDRVLARQPAAAQVADWWANLDGAAQVALLAGAPALLGALNGIPLMTRVEANRLNAVMVLADARAELAQLRREQGASASMAAVYAAHAGGGAGVAVGTSLDDTGSEARIRLLGKQLAYLEQVVSGEIQLYLYDPAKDRAIEMIGDPHAAKVVLSFLPGTDASLETMYDGVIADPEFPYRRGGHQTLAAWEVGRSRGDVLAFVVKDGVFPQFSELFTNGPQSNSAADRIGAAYAEFHAGLRATGVGGLPVVSVEHSFGTAAAGQAERAGAEFDTRVLLGPIGMKDGWTPNPETTYAAYAAPDDINRLFYTTPWGGGLAVGDVGYAVSPTPQNGVMNYDSGIPADNPVGAGLLTLVAPPVGIPVQVAGMVDNHNQIVGTADNLKVLRAIRQRLVGAAE